MPVWMVPKNTSAALGKTIANAAATKTTEAAGQKTHRAIPRVGVDAGGVADSGAVLTTQP
ncbi:hypothetical protein GCM10027058_16040 [Microbacterium neimengense]